MVGKLKLISVAKIVCLATVLSLGYSARADEATKDKLDMTKTENTAPLAAEKYKVDDSTFKCIQKMTAVRHFFVDNLGGNLDATVAVAKAGTGQYPEGTVLQLIPNEVMIKQQKGFNAETRDWEFFFIDVSKDGSKIYERGFKNVNNRLGLNCFECHKDARAEFDLVCEQGHGCADLPLTRAMFHALQHTDPRCQPAEAISADDAKALQDLGPAVEALEHDVAAKSKDKIIKQ